MMDKGAGEISRSMFASFFLALAPCCKTLMSLLLPLLYTCYALAVLFSSSLCLLHFVNFICLQLVIDV